MCEREQKGVDEVNRLKKIVTGSLILIFSLTLFFSKTCFAEDDVSSNVTIGFSEKTIKETTTSAITDNAGKHIVRKSLLPQTSDSKKVNRFTYLGLILMINFISYIFCKKRREYQ